MISGYHVLKIGEKNMDLGRSLFQIPKRTRIREQVSYSNLRFITYLADFAGVMKKKTACSGSDTNSMATKLM
jgi:hypothetical protein